MVGHWICYTSDAGPEISSILAPPLRRPQHDCNTQLGVIHNLATLLFVHVCAVSDIPHVKLHGNTPAIDLKVTYRM